MFKLGDRSQFFELQILFFISVFFLNIHLLNMLIAVMSNTLNDRTEKLKEIMLHNHLKFVTDNFFLIDFAFNEPKKIRYIIVAFYAAQ